MNKDEWHVKIKMRNNGEYIRYDMAMIAGDCCWKLRSRFRGGRIDCTFQPGTFQPGWPIKKVVLTECPQMTETENCK